MNNNFLLRANLLFIMSKYDDEKKSFYDKLTEITDELFDISNKNKDYTTLTLSQLEKQGYTPCKSCNPHD